MKKILLLVTAFVLSLTLAGCDLLGNGGDGDGDGISVVTINGLEDITVDTGTVVDLFEGLTVTADDGESYTDILTVDSDDCTISDADTITAEFAGTCTITYSAVVAGILARQTITVTFEAPPVIIDDTKPILASWDFEDDADLEGWTFDDGVAAITGVRFAEGDGNVLKIDYTSGGNPWEPRLYNQDLPFENGETYTVSFRAKTDQADKILNLQVGEILAGDPWFILFFADGQNEEAALTTEWQEFVYEFDMTIDNTNGGLLFEMGNYSTSTGISGTLYLDDIVIRGGSGEDTAAPSITGADDVTLEVGDTFDATTGVTAEDFVDGDLTSSIVITGDTVDTSAAGTFTVTYTVTDAAGNTATVDRVVSVVGYIVDPNNDARYSAFFDTDWTVTGDESADWYTTIVYGEPIFTAEFTGGNLVMSSAKDGDKAYGTNYWDHIVRWTEMILVNGASYRLEFDIKTDQTGNTDENIMLKVESSDFAVEERKVIGDTTTTVTLEFTYTGTSTINGSILYFVGGREHVITVEDVTIYTDEVGAITDTDPMINGAADKAVELGTAVALLEGVTATDVEDGDITDMLTVFIDGPNGENRFDEDVAGVWTITYKVTDSDGNMVEKEVVIEVVDASAENTLGMWDFSDATDALPWVFDGTIAGEIVSEELVVTYTAGGNPWEPRLVIQDLPFEVGEAYVVTFDAKSDVADKILHLQVGEILSADPWFINFKPASQTETATLGTDWATYSFIFVMQEDNVNGGLLLEFGNYGASVGISGTVTLDNISIKGGSGVDTTAPMVYGLTTEFVEVDTTFDNLAGVAAYDLVDGDLTADITVTGTVDLTTLGTYTLTYEVTDAAGNTGTYTRDITVVGYVTDTFNTSILEIFTTDTTIDFDNTDTWYLQNNWGLPLLTASTTSGELTISNLRDGTEDFNDYEWWNHLLLGQGLRLVEGATYKISFEAKRTLIEDNGFNVVFKVESNGAAVYESGAAGAPAFVLTDTYQQFDIQFVYNGSTTYEALIAIFVGGNQQTVNFRNMTIGMLEPDFNELTSFDPEINASGLSVFATTDTVDLSTLATAGDFEDGDLTDDITFTVLGPNDETTFDSSEGMWTVTYSVTDSDSNTVTKEVEIFIGDFTATTIVPNSYIDGDDTTGWLFTGLATTITAAWGEASLHYPNGYGANPWDVKAETQGLVFEQGATYKISFSARSDADRQFALTIYDPTASTVVFTTGPLDVSPNGPDAWGWNHNYVFIFTYDSANAANLEFQLGNFGDGNTAGVRFDFDNVVIEKYTEPTT
jgi:hypothetical protein